MRQDRDKTVPKFFIRDETEKSSEIFVRDQESQYLKSRDRDKTETLVLQFIRFLQIYDIAHFKFCFTKFTRFTSSINILAIFTNFRFILGLLGLLGLPGVH